jgi:hypothetical protein
MDTIPFVKIADVPAFPDEYELVTQSVADDGALLFLFVESAGREAVHSKEVTGGGARFARTRIDEPMRFRLVKMTEGERAIVDLPPLDVTFPVVDVFPDGKVLVAGTRCAWYGEGEFDLNGIVIDPATGACERILLGDGIARLSIDQSSRIWVGYYDEGIYGNFGWGNPGPRPVGAAGLACFNARGEKVWEFPGASIDECYALNVKGSEAFAYFCAGFPICRISSDFRVASWTTQLKGCRGLAISQSMVFLSSQYDDPPGIGYMGVLECDELRDVRRVALVLPDGSELSTQRLIARGPHLHYFADDAVYRARLEAARPK